MEIQDLDSVVTELTNKGAYSAHKGTPKGRRADGLRKTPIYYTERNDSVIRERDFEVFDKIVGGTEEEPVYEYSWSESIPNILVDKPEPEAPRDFHYTKQEIATELSSFDIINEDDIHITRNGDYDDIRTKIIDDKGLVADLIFMAYNKGGGRELKQVKQ